jgi:aminopeptidase YwaD
MDWTEAGASLTVGEKSFAALVSPYSLGGEIEAPLVIISNLADLKNTDLKGKIVLIDGELAKEQLMPKNFVFYNPDHHREIVGLLETKAPQAIIAATTKDPGLAGGVYPFPLLEDGDFDIPSVYMTDVEGQRLAKHTGEVVSLRITAERKSARGCNVIGRKGQFDKGKIVFCAHIDAKDGTPGAIDNGTGVDILLLLAELLAGYAGFPGVEIVVFNGEDYYAASGEMLYLKNNLDTFGEIKVAVNLDGVGYHVGKTAFSIYGCSPKLENLIREVFTASDELVEGEPWYQSDHAIFIQNQVPAAALTSDQFTALWTEIAHTPLDHPEIVDYRKLVAVAEVLKSLVFTINRAGI